MNGQHWNEIAILDKKFGDATGIIRKGVVTGASLGSNGVAQALDAGGDRNGFIDEVTPVISHAVRSTKVDENGNRISIKNHMIMGHSAGMSG